MSRTRFLYFVANAALMACTSCALSDIDWKPSNGLSQAKPAGSDRAERQEDFVIVPGRRIGKVYIGDAQDKVDNLLVRQSTPVLVNYEGCLSKNGNWLLQDHPAEVVEITFDSNNNVRVIRAYAQNIATLEGIHADDKLTEVKRKYGDVSQLRAFASFGTRSTNDPTIEGWPMYWVDQSRGIAFEFVRVRADAKWHLDTITVFDPSSPFMGDYCNHEEKLWRGYDSLEPSPLEVVNMERRALQ